MSTFMRHRVLLFVYLLLGCGSPMALWGQTRATNYQIDLASALKRESVREQLKLTEEQREALETLDRERNRVVGTAIKEAQKLPPDLRSALAAQMRDQVNRIEDDVVKLLQPEQEERLKQLVLQIKIRAEGPVAGLTHPYMIEQLKLAPNQVEVINTKGADVEAKLKQKLEEIQAEIKRLKEQARAEVMRNLSEEQRRKYVELVGELSDAIRQ